MAVNSKKWEISPERSKVWKEPKPMERKAAVVYYLCRNGQLEHPHFMEIPISSPQGLFLRDVVERLNSLRGQGMANMYSWSSKRSYRNGFVWHDLTENDFIYPTQGHEYVLKGTELLQTSLSFRYYEKISSENKPETNNSGDDCNFPFIIRKRNQSWGSFNPREYKVYKDDPATEHAGKAMDAATQTEDKRRRRRTAIEEGEEAEYGHSTSTTELSREEISPPLSNTSSEEAPVGQSSVAAPSADIRNQAAENDRPSGRMKASAVLKHLIRCGSVSVKDQASTARNGGGCGMNLELQRDAGDSLGSNGKGELRALLDITRLR
ncbi:protein UPSTREAM OF FLC-like [Vitis riparia]|uniref:protein UPSTREAM OF FLC-like n=1 Tax=Vitis riparia TaxID=96939 RepID=UPI00155B0E1D|nr:protein UPSTREAM OF FLC-like [Vitis riparia]XP_034705052.1 protein UPSTREAM OF FLC-like [Vitis riparia]